MAGDSAGANLCAGLSLKVRDEKLKLPRLQVLIYPVVSRTEGSKSRSEYSEGFFLTESAMKYTAKPYAKDHYDFLDPFHSVILHPDHSCFSEAIVVTAEYDSLRDEGESYLAKLQKAGVKATGIRANRMIHGFGNFFSVIPTSKNNHDMGPHWRDPPTSVSMIWFLINFGH